MSQNKPLCIDLFCGLTLSRVPAASRYRDPAACDRWDTTPRTCAVECSPSSAMPRFFGILACEQPPEPSFRGRTRTLSGVSDTSFGAVPSLHPDTVVPRCIRAICGDGACATLPASPLQQPKSRHPSNSVDYCQAGQYQSACRILGSRGRPASRRFVPCGEGVRRVIGSGMNNRVCLDVLP